MRIVAALYVETDGVYFGLPNVKPFDVNNDARRYTGPYPVVAHPPCQRWGRFWHGSTRKPHQYRLGEDEGCFAAALTAVRNYGGVLEHPAHSKAWDYFGLTKPLQGLNWVRSDFYDGWSCQVEQGHYGHVARKATWLYACKIKRPVLNWGRGVQRLPSAILKKHGYEKARRAGMVASIGGKDKTAVRNRTPFAFRDLLIETALSVYTEG